MLQFLHALNCTCAQKTIKRTQARIQCIKMNSPSFSFLTGLSVTKKLKCHGKKNIIWHYFDPWMRIARSLVIFPDSTTPTQALSRASVKPSNLMLLSSFALYLKIILTPTNFALRVLLSDLSVYFDIKYAQRIPM